MRLIDAEALTAGTCAECTLDGDQCLHEKCDWDSIYHIEHAPTVAAIPIDWLIDKFAEAEKAIYYCKGDWRRNAEIMAACRTVMALWKEAGT